MATGSTTASPSRLFVGLVAALIAISGCKSVDPTEARAQRQERAFEECMDASPSPESHEAFAAKVQGCDIAASAAA
jgi:hypothetical protein